MELLNQDQILHCRARARETLYDLNKIVRIRYPIPIDLLIKAYIPTAIIQPCDQRSINRFASGLVFFDDDGHVVIEYDKNEPRERKRFTFAHELGHIMLGHVTEEPLFCGGVRNELEYMADQFSAEMLMPYKKVHKIKQAFPSIACAKLADFFGVSNQSMRYRLDKLGYRD